MHPHQQHDEAKHAAISRISDFIAVLYETKERAMSVFGTVSGVTGGEACPNEFGRAAWEQMAVVPDRIDEAIAQCNETIVQLDHYIF